MSALFRPTLVAGGIDWGGMGGDPLAIVIAGKDGPRWHVFAEAYEQRISTPQLLQVLARFRDRFKVVRWWCDRSQDRAAGLLGTYGFPAIPNEIADIEYGIRTVYALLALERLSVDPVACPNLDREFRLYQHKVTREGEVVGTKPVDKHNHALDALRYLLVGEGETPEPEPDDAAAQPGFYVGADGRWRGNPAARVARTAAVAADGYLIPMEDDEDGGEDEDLF